MYCTPKKAEMKCNFLLPLSPFPSKIPVYEHQCTVFTCYYTACVCEKLTCERKTDRAQKYIRAQATTWGNYSAFLSWAALTQRAWRCGSRREPGFDRSPKILTLGKGEYARRSPAGNTHTQNHIFKGAHLHTHFVFVHLHLSKHAEDIYAANACIVIF